MITDQLIHDLAKPLTRYVTRAFLLRRQCRDLRWLLNRAMQWVPEEGIAEMKREALALAEQRERDGLT